ncbi:hypothetical protein AMTR_s00006p00259330 [Amborella trichopoda]|uniref:Uncharacterized protein n=2 Tax=Amborella trichopoda TaxID=13333 RepID=W1P7G3_AMBTC|nr:hypothetical protein AMTR_s00006p00259330 [Amborella trichopoda]
MASNEEDDLPALNPKLADIMEESEVAEYIEKYNKYEADYVRRLKAKYFSRKAFNGGNIFDKETPIEDEIIKSSRLPCMKTYKDSNSNSEDQSRSSAPSVDASINLPSRKSQCRRSA